MSETKLKTIPRSYKAAKYYYQELLCNILAAQIKTKHPYWKWEQYQNVRCPWEKLEKEFLQGYKNICLITGKSSGITVIDVDTKNGLTPAAKEFIAKLPKTWLSKTGTGGYHLFYKFTKKFDDKIGVFNCIDIRNNGIIILPPSIHPNGNTYEWIVPPWN